MKDKAITAALAVVGFGLTLALSAWRDGGPAETVARDSGPIRLASRDTGVWSANPFVANPAGSPPATPAEQNVQMPMQVQVPQRQQPAGAATSVDESANIADAPAGPSDGASYESQVDRDVESNHASRHR